eukprot:NODE_2154_length_503_cov_561.022026_g1750_i1.p1 GENE.NODE_2154_length_503_cov_561.022026_g1750_i1~~NODE_2154_length_503_cov_561.022026_g1750_i1.p1  ORF type:complete len:167 (-),score=38.27 NODE_2154_length_503_cov_561.022026_g1750_i1:3-476(-)
MGYTSQQVKSIVLKWMLIVHGPVKQSTVDSSSRPKFIEGELNWVREATDSKMMITGLCPDAYYRVYIRSYDGVGHWCSPCTPLRIATLPPLQIRILRLGEHFALVQASRQKRNRELRHRHRHQEKRLMQMQTEEQRIGARMRRGEEKKKKKKKKTLR